jgi:hypothetical protein
LAFFAECFSAFATPETPRLDFFASEFSTEPLKSSSLHSGKMNSTPDRLNSSDFFQKSEYMDLWLPSKTSQQTHSTSKSLVGKSSCMWAIWIHLKLKHTAELKPETADSLRNNTDCFSAVAPSETSRFDLFSAGTPGEPPSEPDLANLRLLSNCLDDFHHNSLDATTGRKLTTPESILDSHSADKELLTEAGMAWPSRVSSVSTTNSGEYSEKMQPSSMYQQHHEKMKPAHFLRISEFYLHRICITSEQKSLELLQSMVGVSKSLNESLQGIQGKAFSRHEIAKQKQERNA